MIIVRGVNLSTHVDILCKTPTGMAAQAQGRPRPRLQVLFRPNQQRRMGTAWPHENRIILYVRPKDEWQVLIDTLCHEMAHQFAPIGSRHNKVWKQTFADLAREAYNLIITPYRTHQERAKDSLHRQLKHTVRCG